MNKDLTLSIPRPPISILRFRSELDSLKAHLLEHDGFVFESFSRGKMHDWEGYKDYVFAEAGRRLGLEDWEDDEAGTGVIIDRVIDAIEINDGKQKRNNLLKWQQYGAHNILSEVKNDERCFQVESLLFDFYTDELEAEDVFDPLVSLLGKKYNLIAYLFFIKDSSRFLPVSPKNFDAVFERLGVNFKTSGQCSWENYSDYLFVIREIRSLLETEGYEGLRLLEAHSFCWLLSSIDELEQGGVTVIPVEADYSPSSVNSTPSPGRDVDWEALHHARAALGRLGEELASEFEKNRLKKAGYPELAEKVYLVSDDHTKGYDLHSFEVDGSDRLIEVKAMGQDTPSIRFYTSKRQLDLAHSDVNHFYYLVRGARTASPRVQVIRASSIDESAINPIVYEVAWRENSI